MSSWVQIPPHVKKQYILLLNIFFNGTDALKLKE